MLDGSGTGANEMVASNCVDVEPNAPLDCGPCTKLIISPLATFSTPLENVSVPNAAAVSGLLF